MNNDVDIFYEYAKNNFLNFINKNNKTVKNEDKKKSNLNWVDKSDIEKLKNEEMNDNENYDKKYRNYLLKKKKKKKKDKYDKKDKYIKKGKIDKKDKYKKHKKKEKKSLSSDDSYKKKKHKHKHKSSSDDSYKKKRKKKHRHKHTSSSDDSYEKNKKKHEHKKHKDKKNDDNYALEIENIKEKNDLNDEYIKEDICNIKKNNNFIVTEENIDSMFPENKKLKIKLENIINEKKEAMILKNSLNKNLVECKYCLDSMSFNKINKFNVVSISNGSYICYYNYKNIFLKKQLFICPIEHTTSITNTKLETIIDIRNHMKSLLIMLEKTNETCIFIEFNNCFNKNIELISMRKIKHTYINCYVIPINLLNTAKTYFKKNLDDINSLSRENKQLIISNNKYAPYKVIPPSLPYISINFALTETYIQIIENNYNYINMCKCIFTDLIKEDKLYKYFKTFNEYVETVEQFKKDYIKYDWTNYTN